MWGSHVKESRNFSSSHSGHFIYSSAKTLGPQLEVESRDLGPLFSLHLDSFLKPLLEAIAGQISHYNL